MDEWKSVDSGIWRPLKEGDQIVGALMDKEPRDETAGLSARYHLQNETGRFLVWGSAIIDDRMRYVNKGDKVRITYEGTTKNKRNQDVHLYRVEVARNLELEGIHTTDESREEESVYEEEVDDLVV